MRFVLYLISVPISIFLYGLTLSYLWSWFVVPIFELPSLSVLTAYGLVIISRFMTTDLSAPRADMNDKENSEKVVVAGIVYPLYMLLIGWIITLFM